MNKYGLKTRQQGMTLIEIMIALLIGAFLLGGILQVFLNSSQTSRTQENLSRMQENGRFALEFLSRDIRVADFRTCFSDPSVATAVAGTNDDAAIMPLLVTTDGITVTQSSNACGAGSTTTSVAYSIRPDPNSGQPALFKSTDGAAAQALIEGIENMQILYGEDTDMPPDGTADYYVDWDTIVSSANVVSVRISLLVRSLDNNLIPQPRQYTYNGALTTADRRIKRVFSTTISLRNRL